uniref:Uncharacterized protein LOC104238966 n=1 Tax=Nicotiana sylvestris TaxID=4096 RepID=A0A1U7XIA5_NICSY|nr:PREDICTED: uncharacterized protein LOC104238966 [Nicotiana sylvestris]
MSNFKHHVDLHFPHPFLILSISKLRYSVSHSFHCFFGLSSWLLRVNFALGESENSIATPGLYEMCASQMSSNKRKMDKDLIDHTTDNPYLCAKNSERNLRRRIAYREMPPDKKAALLEQRRTEYAARNRRLSEILPPILPIKVILLPNLKG